MKVLVSFGCAGFAGQTPPRCELCIKKRKTLSVGGKIRKTQKQKGREEGETEKQEEIASCERRYVVS